jgi:hypothetical protein
MKDLELLITVGSVEVFAGAGGEFAGGGKTTPLFELPIIGPRPSVLAGLGGKKTRSDFEPLITAPSDADPLDDGGGKMTPSLELYITVLPDPVAESSGAKNAGPESGVEIFT